MTYSQLSHNAREIVAKFTLATTQEVQLGCDWYPSALAIAGRIADKYDTSPEIVAGVIAALSPNNRWERNIVDAEAIIKCWAAGGTRTDMLNVKVCTYGKMKAKAVEILKNSERPQPGSSIFMLGLSEYSLTSTSSPGRYIIQSYIAVFATPN
mgnify:CR=1 FL=1